MNGKTSPAADSHRTPFTFALAMLIGAPLLPGGGKRDGPWTS
jgi:hypothetical protein